MTKPTEVAQTQQQASIAASIQSLRLTMESDGSTTMSSLELVDFINFIRPVAAPLRHDNFMVKVPTIIGEIDAPKFLGTQKYGNNITRKVYNLPRTEAAMMAMSYSPELMRAVMNAWDDAERSIKAIVPFLGLIPGFIASSKGRSFFLWWLYGCALFIVALPHSLLASKNSKVLDEKAIEDGSMRKCPSCAEVVKTEAIVCRYCQRDLPTVEVAAKTQAKQEEEMLILMDKYGIHFDGFKYYYNDQPFMSFNAALKMARDLPVTLGRER